MNALVAAPWRQMVVLAGIGDGQQRWRWLLGGMLLGIVVMPLALVALFAPGHLASALCAALSVLLIAVWSALSSGLLRQNHPHAARLVPGHVRRLRRLFLSTWVAVLVACGVLMGAAFGHGVQWAVAAAAMMLFFAWATAWPKSVWLAWATWFLLVPLTPLRHLVPTVTTLWSLAPWPLVSLSLVTLATAWLSSRWLLGQGGPWHHKRYEAARRIYNAKQLALSGSASAPKTAFWSALDRWFRWGYHAWLAYLLSRPCSSRARLAMLFGPQLHWASALCAVLLIGGVGLAALVLLVPASSAADAQDALPGLGFGLMMTSAGVLAGLRLVLYRTRREQALVMLAPGLPRGIDLNRWLARRLVAYFLLLVTLVVGLALLAVVWLFDASAPPVALGIVGAYLAVAVPAGLPLLARDWSRLGPPATWSGLVVMAAAALIGLVVLVLVAKLDVPAATIMMVGLPLLAVAGLWCWRRVQQVPQMLPVARLPARGF